VAETQAHTDLIVGATEGRQLSHVIVKAVDRIAEIAILLFHRDRDTLRLQSRAHQLNGDRHAALAITEEVHIFSGSIHNTMGNQRQATAEREAVLLNHAEGDAGDSRVKRIHRPH
jgi:hypothetical protein